MMEIIDFHSHILPGVDDGSASVAESIAMLRMEAEQGIEHVIATPHFYPRHDSPDRFLKRREEAEAILREEMAKHKGLPRLSVGAEVYFFSGIADCDTLQELTMDKKDCIILEMPHSAWTQSMYKEMEGISVKQGITPIIAHIDRYIRPFKTHEIMKHLDNLPVLVQANASFFLHASTRQTALRLLREEKIHVLGSDCHNVSTRPPNIGQAMEVIVKRLGPEAIQRICACQQMLLSD